MITINEIIDFMKVKDAEKEFLNKNKNSDFTKNEFV